MEILDFVFFFPFIAMFKKQPKPTTFVKGSCGAAVGTNQIQSGVTGCRISLGGGDGGKRWVKMPTSW